jgi:YD repeat-containing protein
MPSIRAKPIRIILVSVSILMIGGAIIFALARIATREKPSTEISEDQLKAAGIGLPVGTTLRSEFTWATEWDGQGDRLSVRQKLREVGARFRAGQLHDDSGKEIRFYQMYNPGVPINYDDMMQRQHQELQQLKREFRVLAFYLPSKD